ncbi:hypothetical protein V6N13_024688 [Hibiscus sabdariffa]|uniref:Uncharacterized protein n=1 Tax=Hibiscus sabdariffa TaxID=183260 RepID=A0ABR2DX32_9ROSI
MPTIGLRSTSSQNRAWAHKPEKAHLLALLEQPKHKGCHRHPQGSTLGFDGGAACEAEDGATQTQHRDDDGVEGG